MLIRPSFKKRAGLAPLELVLTLPVLVVALIFNLGVIAMWRVRGEVVSREAVWQSRWPRTGHRESPPPNWTEGATMRALIDRPILQLHHPDVDRPVVGGPLPNHFRVIPVLDPIRGSRKGSSSLIRRYPMLPRLGPYDSGEIENAILDQKGACALMGIPNVFRRTKKLYMLPSTDQQYPTALARASQDMFSIPHYVHLYVLDRDEDVLALRGHYVDFHPRVRHPYPGNRLVDVRYCELDPQVVRRNEVNRLIDTLGADGRVRLGRISRLPRTLTNFFLDMYNREINQLKAQIQAWQDELSAIPRPTPARRAELRQLIRDATAELARIEPFIQPLEEYQARLPDIERQLREQVERGGV